MKLPRQTMMMLLFVSIENPIWRALCIKRPTPAKIANYIRISRTDVSNWKRGGRVGDGMVDKIFRNIKQRINTPSPNDARLGYRLLDENTKREISTALERFADVLENSDNYTVYEAAKILSINIEKSQIVIDDAINEWRPLFAEVYSNKSELDGQHGPFNTYRGVYHLYIRRRTGDNNIRIWLKCVLRVRYIIKIRNRYIIRCKLNFPIISPIDINLPYWEYDGYLIDRHFSVFWIFEKRDSPPIDYFHIITYPGRLQTAVGANTKVHTLLGNYLTTGQGTRRSIKMGDVFLQRADVDIANMDEIISLMHSRDAIAVIEDEGECRGLDEAFERFQKRDNEE